ncbi:MAG: MotA/TolQ/ExbB proton channel family protein [Myxococcota bacterium]
MDIVERLSAFANLGAGWVMYLLICLSVIAVAIIIERLVYFVGSREASAALREAFRKHLGEGDMDAAKRLLAGSKSPQAQVVHAAMEATGDGVKTVEARLAAERIIAKGRMERNLAFLGTVGNNAPFVGLLGTVIGIVRAFQALRESGGQISNALYSEVGEALIATAIGLLVALPAVASFNTFNRLIKGRLTWAEAMGRDLLGHLQRVPEAGYPETGEGPEAD